MSRLDLDNLTALQKEERRCITAQTKLTPSESQDLDDLVHFFRVHRVPDATRSSVIRAVVLDAILKLKDSW